MKSNLLCIHIGTYITCIEGRGIECIYAYVDVDCGCILLPCHTSTSRSTGTNKCHNIMDGTLLTETNYNYRWDGIRDETMSGL
jgi:hypothetical protein